MNYKNKRWENKRLAILKRDGYKCKECARYGRLKDATMVHHIYPVEYYPELRYISDNLISLCNACHDKMHNRDDHELTQKGKELQRRTAIAQRPRPI